MSGTHEAHLDTLHSDHKRGRFAVSRSLRHETDFH